MPRLISLLKLKKNASLAEKKPQIICTKCGKRLTTGKDGLCDQCRFNDVLTQLVETK